MRPGRRSAGAAILRTSARRTTTKPWRLRGPSLDALAGCVCLTRWVYCPETREHWGVVTCAAICSGPVRRNRAICPRSEAPGNDQGPSRLPGARESRRTIPSIRCDTGCLPAQRSFGAPGLPPRPRQREKNDLASRGSALAITRRAPTLRSGASVLVIVAAEISAGRGLIAHVRCALKSKGSGN